MEKIIGLVGAKGAGKTTAFGILGTLTDGVVEITLAKKLKDVCSEVFGVERHHFDSHKHKEKELPDPAYITRQMAEAILSSYFDLTTLTFDKHVRPHIGKVLYTPRQIAQYVGTEVLRNVDADIHCKAAVAAAGEGRIGVVTDMRFPNEFNFFKQNYPSFIPIYIKNTRAEVGASADTHASEAYLSVLAAQSNSVDNESTIEVFESNLKALVKSLGALK